MEIKEFRDSGVLGLLGYYCESHVNPQQFATQCGKEFKASWSITPAAEDVEQGYFKKVFEDDAGESLGSDFLLHPCEKEDAGAFPVTYIYLYS